jgi:hypothetical protein
MYETSQSIYPVQGIFGAGFVPESHHDEFSPGLLVNEKEHRELRFAEILKALRSALAIRRQ